MTSQGLLSLQAALSANSLTPSQAAALLAALNDAIPFFTSPDDRSVVGPANDIVAETWASALYALDAEGPQPVPPPIHWNNDLASSTNDHQWVSGISGANGTGATCAVASTCTLTQTQAGTSAMKLFAMVPSALGGGGEAFSCLLATETSGGANNPAWQIGYNAHANLGSERALWTIERNFQNVAPVPNDTEMHLQFFDAAGLLVTRSFSSSYFFYPTPQVVTSVDFKDGVDSMAAPQVGYFSVTSTGTPVLRVETTQVSLENGCSTILFQFGHVPLLTQQDETAAGVNAFTIRAARSVAGAQNTADIELQVRATNAGTQGKFRYQQETALGSGVFSDVVSISRDAGTGDAVIDAPGAQVEVQASDVTVLKIINVGAGNQLWSEFTNSPAEPGASGAGGPPRLYGFGGALKAIGSGGTRVTVCAAEPHCPQCGADFMTEHENPKYGYLAVCLKCLADALGNVPWVVRKPPSQA